MNDSESSIIDENVLVDIVENQLQDATPIKVKETLMRLMMTGHSREDAIAMIACALSLEVFDVTKNNAKFNDKRYSQHLDALPDLAFMEGDE